MFAQPSGNSCHSVKQEWSVLDIVDSYDSWQWHCIKSPWPMNQWRPNHPSLGKYRVRFPRASGYKIFENQSANNLVLHVFLCQDIYCSICCWFINMELMTQSTHAWKKLILTQSIFSVRHITDVLCPETRGSTSLGGHLKQQNHKLKEQRCGKHGTE